MQTAVGTREKEDQSEEVREVERAYGEEVIVGNVNKLALNEMSDGVAHATLVFAQTTSAVSGTEKGGGHAFWRAEVQGIDGAQLRRSTKDTS